MKRLFVILLLFLSYNIIAQDKCPVGSEYFLDHKESIDQFEQWIIKQKTKPSLNQSLGALSVYQIPIVFHIIHNGEPLGEGLNIPDQRIFDQIQILNEDFRRTNTDRDLTPLEFLTVAADSEIEFVLARQDPEGLPTNGIVRKLGSEVSYNFSEDVELKTESYWPAEDYLNIYVADLISFLGWAEFPFSNLAGITYINNNRLIDGVALDYKYVGYNTNATNFDSYGRTATHEIGHFLGLKHVWGEGGCSSVDFCNDTPVQNKSYINECPTGEQATCETNDMYSNYLNYTDDACMNIFTLCQKERMRIVLENSPRRKSLLTSHALEFPETFANDLGVVKINSPEIKTCQTQISPVIEVRNYGDNIISSFEIEMVIDGISIETFQKNTTLDVMDVALVNFSAIEIADTATTTIEFQVLNVNDGVDGNNQNNIKSIVLYPFLEQGLPYHLNFESETSTYTKLATGEASAWSIVQAPNSTNDNLAAQLPFYNKQSDFGEFDYLVTPVFDFSSLNSAELTFKYAYATFSTESKDGLIVAISHDCGQTFPTNNRIFTKYGDALATSAQTNESFVPINGSNWIESTINITPWLGSSETRIAFIGHNGADNNIYIDDINITTTALKAYDIGISELKNISPVICSGQITPSIIIKNYGFQPIDSFQVSYAIENVITSSIKRIHLVSGESASIRFVLDDLPIGEYDIVFETSRPNDQTDEWITNNQISYHIVVDQNEDNLPVRQNFDDDSKWFIGSDNGTAIWSEYNDGLNVVLKANAFENEQLLTEHWLISPTLSTDVLDEASLRFQYAYANRGSNSDRLKILLSVSCGRGYEFTIFDQASDQLTALESEVEYIPQPGDWQEEFIDISEYLVWPSIRLAFVFVNGNGNNLYLDDIEVFTTNDPDQLLFQDKLHIYPNPAQTSFNVQLNLIKKQRAVISLIDMSGRIVSEKTIQEALNQLLFFDTPSQGGFYLVRLKGNNLEITRRLFIRR